MRHLLERLWFYFFAPYATMRKRCNFLRARLAVLGWRRPVARYYPYSLVVCTGNICNLTCPLCPTGCAKPGRTPGLMSMVTFRHCLDECGPYLYKLELYNWGEPLLNPNFFAMVQYAKRFGILVAGGHQLERVRVALLCGVARGLRFWQSPAGLVRRCVEWRPLPGSAAPDVPGRRGREFLHLRDLQGEPGYSGVLTGSPRVLYYAHSA